MKRKLEDFLEEVAFELGLENRGEFQQEELTTRRESQECHGKGMDVEVRQAFLGRASSGGHGAPRVCE